MITNRPLPPKKIFVGDPFPSGFDGYDYFSSQSESAGSDINRNWHGMPQYFAEKELVWEPIISYIGHPGMVYFLAFCIENTTGSDAEFGIRLAINGNIAYIEDRILLAHNAQHGNALIGNMFFKTDGTFQAVCSSWAPYDTAFQLHVYRETDAATFPFVAVCRNYWTT